MSFLALPIVRTLADLICPEQCAACRTLVGSGTIFCHACRAYVNVLGPPECTLCGMMMVSSGSCVRCSNVPDRSVRYARAWALYRVGQTREPVVRALASFKYDGVTRLCRRMGELMASRVPDPSVSLIVPVPLHVRRLRSRGFNQSALLARHIGRALGRRVDFTLLTRCRDTPSQTTSNASDRRASVAGAFQVTRPATARNRTILVVDDVWTSGATARSVAMALHAAGAAAVDVVTFARVQRS